MDSVCQGVGGAGQAGWAGWVGWEGQWQSKRREDSLMVGEAIEKADGLRGRVARVVRHAGAAWLWVRGRPSLIGKAWWRSRAHK